ncbi:MAG: ADP-glyceromanno-heptose 6-epimerase [Leptospirillia bacterium]
MIVVTGGAGFIGSALVKKLNALGHTNILVVDNLAETEKWRNLVGKKIADYMHRDTFLEWITGHGREVKTIFHMGACSTTTERDVDFLMSNNFAYSKAMWWWGTEHSGNLIYASSAATYGDGAQGYSDEPHKIGTLRPLNAYGYSKQLFDQWATAQAARGNAPTQWAGLKFFNVYGPNEYHKGRMASVIYHAFGQAKDTGEVRLFKSYRDGIADGEQRRDFVYVKDCVDVMAWLMEHPEVCGIYNLGTGSARTFRDLAEATLKAMGLPINVSYIDMPEDLRGRYQYFTEASMDRLWEAGYPATFRSLEDGVTDYVGNYLDSGLPYL